MESARDLLKSNLNALLLTIPNKIPEESKKFMGPIANSLKLAARMLPDFPKSDLKGLDWLFGIIGGMAPGLINSLTEAQLREAAYKAINLGVELLEALPPEPVKMFEGGEKEC